MNFKIIIISIGAIITFLSSLNFNNVISQNDVNNDIIKDVSVSIEDNINANSQENKLIDNDIAIEEKEMIDEEITIIQTEEKVIEEQPKIEQVKKDNVIKQEKQPVSRPVQQEMIKQPETIQETKVQEEKIETPKTVITEKEPETPTCTETKHCVGVGNSNKWFNSYDEASNFYNNLINDFSNKAKNGEITYEEYCKKCPYGYETWSCQYCGKWTLNYYFR
ncbi:MAG: hypothetical protein J6A89_08860 [Clostridia bacterium]|nr:hypothetical protein [Clostridia bacterium]